MTWGSRLLLFFPAAHAAAVVAALGWLLASPGFTPATSAAVALWGLPVIAFQILRRVAPLTEGVSRLVGGPFSPWWASHQLQWWFIAAPSLEEPLRAVPGLFSAWLRLWGARVGRGVVWTPGLMLADRPLLEVGDGVVFGYGVQISAHVIKPTDEGRDLLCVVRAVRIGDRAFVGALSRLGPGVRVDPAAVVPAASTHVGARIRA